MLEERDVNRSHVFVSAITDGVEVALSNPTAPRIPLIDKISAHRALPTSAGFPDVRPIALDAARAQSSVSSSVALSHLNNSRTAVTR